MTNLDDYKIEQEQYQSVMNITDEEKVSFLLEHFEQLRDHLRQYEYMPCYFTLKESGVYGLIEAARVNPRTDKALESFYDKYELANKVHDYREEDKNTKGCDL